MDEGPRAPNYTKKPSGSKQAAPSNDASKRPAVRSVGDGTPWLSSCKYEENEGKGRVGSQEQVS